MRRLFVMVTAALALTACETIEVEREIGYKGKARVNPWLAAERFVGRMGWQVRSVISWTAPLGEDAVWILPASILSNESFTRRIEDWVGIGGHLILLIEHADEETNDWSDDHPPLVMEPALFSMLERAGIVLKPPASTRGGASASDIVFAGRTFKVDATSQASVALTGGEPGVFASVKAGDGRITVLTDGRLLRNRWISDNDHAALLDALVKAMQYEGTVVFVRGSGLSLWALLRAHLGPFMLALAVWVLFWLWKNFKRFGPMEAVSVPAELRGYAHHLEALGDFQWRLDRTASLLAPLRQQICELGQRAGVHAGSRDEDFSQLLADRAALPRERVQRALAAAVPADPAHLTRITTDLQQLSKVLHNPSLP
ncbi:MAG: hypothetical protein NTV46_15605 [Verrucomicrobia bacterium]|nr:hypothetical protein [Verrucomicrobiota bacterium]